jgi:decaprenylphospho-beta-D-erythro-pentofuranosid-2-ulose 2-reductase
VRDGVVIAAHSSARRIVVIGGTSEIARAIVGALVAAAPREVALLGRDRLRLAQAAEELTRAGCEQVSTIEIDADDTDQHDAAVATAFERLGGAADIVIVAVGLLGERGGLPDDVKGALDVLRVNLVGTGSLLIQAARRLDAQRHGTLIVLSSVAGERVRRSNVVYGAAKAGLDALAQGLGDALHDHGVRVMVVRPGFVHTRMTHGLRAAPLSVAPEDVARAVLRGLDRGDSVVWAPASLRWLMLMLRMLPRRIFRRIPL